MTAFKATLTQMDALGARLGAERRAAAAAGNQRLVNALNAEIIQVNTTRLAMMAEARAARLAA